MQHDDDLVADILLSARYVATFVQRWTRASLDDRAKLNQVVRELEVIGEACRGLSEEFRAQHPDIPWSDIIGMRNLLIHAYREVDADIVWEAVTVDVPKLARELGGES